MRYILYETDEERVSLKKETEYLQSYIDLQRQRIGNKVQLKVRMETGEDEHCIPPMLLIPFIENAFKHSKNTTDKHILINIALKTWGPTVLFSVKNSYAIDTSKKDNLKNDSGVGMANAMKRLQLLYPDKYHLKVEDKDGIYHVMLQLNVDVFNFAF